ncbi:hypothetical protein DAPPUDRAFT_242644 [Daphnia pulex]|uniref:Uncharacterized protein n=1 Tax=Daphnia pulex TaxID=6669 RepID=E9GH51_DAPPU|nr:hypothetical protein DAPPUDRAFT_242644 [Daphnia pulex]|eukprot:EFX81250.1 hypothetical protein DAPPUDRAFT_242644 [Daphnia pulex]
MARIRSKILELQSSKQKRMMDLFEKETVLVSQLKRNLLDAFKSELFTRGISKDSLYIYCHCLESNFNKSKKYETIVKCEDLLNAIRENVTLCGLRPAANAYLLAMSSGSKYHLKDETLLIPQTGSPTHRKIERM